MALVKAQEARETIDYNSRIVSNRGEVLPLCQAEAHRDLLGVGLRDSA